MKLSVSIGLMKASPK